MSSSPGSDATPPATRPPATAKMAPSPANAAAPGMEVSTAASFGEIGRIGEGGAYIRRPNQRDLSNLHIDSCGRGPLLTETEGLQRAANESTPAMGDEIKLIVAGRERGKDVFNVLRNALGKRVVIESDHAIVVARVQGLHLLRKIQQA